MQGWSQKCIKTLEEILFKTVRLIDAELKIKVAQRIVITVYLRQYILWFRAI